MMNFNFNRYLENTTIFENGPDKKENKYYNSKKILGINNFTKEIFQNQLKKIGKDDGIFSKEYEQIKKDFNIEFSNIDNEIIRNIFFKIINENKDKNKDYAIRDIFRNIITLIDNGKIFPYTEVSNFYTSIGSYIIKDKFSGENFNKIRETRNKFFEHKEDAYRKVEYSKIENNSLKVEMEILIKKENKKYKFTLYPLFDFYIFINEITRN